MLLNPVEQEIMSEVWMDGRIYATGGEKEDPSIAFQKTQDKCIRIKTIIESRMTDIQKIKAVIKAIDNLDGVKMEYPGIKNVNVVREYLAGECKRLEE